MRPAKRANGLRDAAERMDVAHDRAHVLGLEEINGHEEVLSGHAELGARLHVR